jgi:endogenous inhibitor of DNA gyrase (YacG/DUF329 family)
MSGIVTVEHILPRDQWDRERMADGTFRVRCARCGKSVSSPLVEPVILRAWVECPECIEQRATAKLEKRARYLERRAARKAKRG